MFTKIPSEAGINIVDVAVLALSPVFFGLTYGARRLTHRAIQTTVEKMNTVTASMLVEMREKVCDDIATYHGATAEVLSEGSVDVEYNGDIYPARVTYMNVHGAPKVELLGEPTIVPLLEQDSTEYQKGTSSVKE